MSRRITAVLCVLMAAAFAAGCTLTPSNPGTTTPGGPDVPPASNGVVGVPGPDVNTPEQMQAEFDTAKKTLSLPQGAKWPDDAPNLDPAPDGRGVMRGQAYEHGYGATLAEGFWFCSWAKEWLAQRAKDNTREQAALDALGKFRDTQSYRVAHDDYGREHLDSMIQLAGLGDPSKLASHVGLSCTSW